MPARIAMSVRAPLRGGRGREEDFDREHPEGPVGSRVPARPDGGGGARVGAAVVGSRAGLRHPALCRVLLGARRDRPADPEPAPSPPDRLAAVRPRGRERRHLRPRPGLGAPSRHRGLAGRHVRRVGRGLGLVGLGARPRAGPAAVPDRSSARAWLVGRGLGQHRRCRGRGARLGARPGHRPGVRRRHQPLRRRGTAHRRPVRRRLRPHRGCDGRRPRVRDPALPSLDRCRAPADEVVCARQRPSRRGAVGLRRTLERRPCAPRVRGSRPDRMACRHRGRDPALPPLRRRPGDQPHLQLRPADRPPRCRVRGRRGGPRSVDRPRLRLGDRRSHAAGSGGVPVPALTGPGQCRPSLPPSTPRGATGRR